MPGVNVYVVVDKEGHGEDAIIGARLTPEEAEALRQEMAAEALEETEPESDEDRAEVEDECELRYEIVELGA